MLKWHSLNGRNLYRTCQWFSLNTKTVLRWIKNQSAIYDSKKGRKRVQFWRTAEHPDIEETLNKEYRGLCQSGLKVKRWWFKTRGEQLLQLISPHCNFKFSKNWFDEFKRRYKISLRRPTHKAQVIPSSKAKLVRSFHRAIRKEASKGHQLDALGRLRLNCIANFDETPLPFTFTNGLTYESKGASTVWVQGGSSGLDKRQCTVQLTIFADGIPRIKPLVIFRGICVNIIPLNFVNSLVEIVVTSAPVSILKLIGMSFTVRLTVQASLLVEDVLSMVRRKEFLLVLLYSVLSSETVCTVLHID